MALFGVQPAASGTIGIRDAVIHAVENAADRAGVVNDAVGLAALDDGDTSNRPSIGDLAFNDESPRKKLWQLVSVGEINNVRAIEVGHCRSAERRFSGLLPL